jgi:transposase
LRTITGIGVMTAEVILSELDDVARFGSHTKLAADAGLAPGRRESVGKVKGQGDHQGGIGVVALGVGRSLVAAGAAVAAVAGDLRPAEGAAG